MIMNEKRESAQIIQFPLNGRATERRQTAEILEGRMIEALEPAWYHTDAMRETAPKGTPKH